MKTLSVANDNIGMDNVIDTYTDMIWRIAVQNMKNREDAEDVVQDVFLRLLKYNGAFSTHEHLKAWLIRVTVNRCRDIWKSAWFQRRTSLEDIYGMAFTDSNNELLSELNKLPKKYRTVLYLHYYEGYKSVEIAEMLGGNKNTVNTQLKRARAKLKEYLVEEEYLNE